MVARRVVRYAAGAIVLMMSAGGCGDDDANTAASAATAFSKRPSSSAQLVALLRNFQPDFEPAGSPVALAGNADLTVTGSVERIEEGRSFATAADSGPVFYTVMLAVRVDQVLDGDASAVDDGLLYLEIDRVETLTAQDYIAAIPENQRMALFLDERTDVTQGGPVTPAQGIPADARLFSPYAEGIVLEDAQTGQLVGGYVDLADLAPSWQGFDTIDALSQLVRPEAPPASAKPTETT